MSQSDYGTIDPATKTGSALAGDLNSQRDAYHSNHKANSAPSYITSGMLWVNDTTSTDWKLNFYDGTNSVELFSVDSVAHTADYSGALSGVGNLTMTGNLTLSTNEATINLQDATGTGVINMNATGSLDYDATVGHTFRVGGASKFNIANTLVTSQVDFKTIGYTQADSIRIGADGSGEHTIAHIDDWDTTGSQIEITTGGVGGTGVNLNHSASGKITFAEAGTAYLTANTAGVTLTKAATFSDRFSVNGPFATKKGGDLASATTLTIPTNDGNYFDVTGSTQIEGLSISLGSLNCHVYLQFDGALTLKHGANFILPGGADITTQVGDVGLFVQESSGVWRLVSWQSIILSGTAGTGDVTASANIADHRVVRGNGGAKGIQESGVTLDDSDNMSGVGTLDTTGAITVDIGAYAQTPDVNADNLSVQESSSQVGISIIGTTGGNCNLFFGDSAAPSQGRIIYENSGDTMNFRTAGVERFHVNSTELKTVVESLHDGASAGHTMQSGTGDGTTTIDWGAGNLYKHTFGAQNETFTFTAPTNPGTFILILVQDSVGSRTATWPASVDWPAGTAPTLTTTATTGTDIIHFIYDGTNYYGTSAADFS